MLNAQGLEGEGMEVGVVKGESKDKERRWVVGL
jgi:hypothetical protein